MASGWGGAFGGAASGGAWGTTQAGNPAYSNADPELEDQPPPPSTGGFTPAGASGVPPQPYSSFAGAFQPTATSVALPPSDLNAREAQLAAREAEFAAREKELKALESQLVTEGRLTRKNWPRCWPIIYHDIEGEIQDPGSRRVVREVYVCWWGFMACLIWNFFCASVMLGTDAEHKASSWFLTIIYFVLGVPIGFWVWYLAIYRAGKNDSTVRFIYFFLGFMIHTAFCIWAAIAVPFSAESWSFCGWFAAIQALDYGAFPVSPCAPSLPRPPFPCPSSLPVPFRLSRKASARGSRPSRRWTTSPSLWVPCLSRRGRTLTFFGSQGIRLEPW
mmetsp:Transcript_20106/g.59704  ORF Transcript_20106/g.59704 Transcript_20106/m.59704 type:complete len:332 (-) Transcript_20106:99-1094(-)